ncbi:MAG TPA: hypothetical protein VF763_04950 [Candidatus Limnocylindrales bacterium]
MNGRSSIGRGLVALGLVVGAIAVAVVAYQVGLSTGLASAGNPGAAVAYPWHYGPAWGWGWGFFGLLFPILFIVFIVLLVRALVWRGGPGSYGRRWGGPDGRWDDPRRPLFDEWHRQAHGQGEDRPADGHGSGS